jgi:hypothetical protein
MLTQFRQNFSDFIPNFSEEFQNIKKYSEIKENQYSAKRLISQFLSRKARRCIIVQENREHDAAVYQSSPLYETFLIINQGPIL